MESHAQLEDVESGIIHMKLSWLPATTDKTFLQQGKNFFDLEYFALSLFLNIKKFSSIFYHLNVWRHLSYIQIVFHNEV